MTVLYDGTFPGGATSAGAAGTTTGAADTATVGTANKWEDLQGGIWHRDGSGNLVPNSGAAYNTSFLLRHSSVSGEGASLLDGSISADLAAGFVGRTLVPCRYANSGNDWSELGVLFTAFATATFTAYMQKNGSFANSPSDVDTGAAINAGHRYRVEAVLSGSNPTTVTQNLYDLDGATPGTPVGTRTFSDSSGSQSAGRWGVGAWDTGGAAAYTRIIIKDATVAPPTLSGAGTNGSGTAITATLSESGCTADGGGSSGAGGFTLSGTSATVSSWAISGTTLTLTLSGAVSIGDTVTYSYARASTTDDIKNSGGSYLADFSGAAVTNNVSDTTPPTLTSPVGTATGATTATIGATTDEGNGTLYGVVTTNSTAPTATQVKAGQNSSGSAALFAGSTSVSSTGAKTISATGLTASTSYYAHLMHEDAAGNKSSVVSSAQFTTDAAPLVMGALSVTDRTTTDVTIGWSAATGGTGSKTYDVYYHTSAPFTAPGTGTHAGTTSGTSFTITPGSADVFVRVLATDGASTTALSSQSADQGALVARVYRTARVVSLIGDSITENMGSAAGLITALSNLDPESLYTLGTNQGVGGTTSEDWKSGTTRLSDAIAACVAANSTDVFVSLGPNDAKTAVATTTVAFSANLAGIAADCVTAGLRVLLNGPTYVVPGAFGAFDEACVGRLIAYRDSIPALADGTNIFAGSDRAFDYFRTNPNRLADEVHPDSTGQQELQYIWATGYQRSMVPAGGGSGPVPMIGSPLIRSLQ